jgi:23S rRNA (uracil1939-C5)-methyltransferase
MIPMLSAGDIVPLTIDKPAAGGRMIARADGLVVLVSGAIPGERVRAKIERLGKGVAYAAALDIEQPSGDRRATIGDPLCGGCLYAHIAYRRQLDLKALVIADAFTRIGRIDLPAPVHVAPSPEEGYRMRARLHVRGRVVGFFREGTHEVCDVRQTHQLLPATCDTLDRLVAAMHSLGGADMEDVREIELAENLDASHRVVYLDLAAPVEARSLERLADIDGLTGVAAAGAVQGEVRVTDVVTIEDHPTVTLRRHVLAFFQGNRYLVNRLVGHVVAQLPSGGDIIDLYAGVGVFAVTAAVIRGARVKAVEGDRTAASDLTTNAATTNGAVTAVHQSVEEFLARSLRSPRLKADGDPPAPTLIVDPPRTGMSPEALDGIGRLHAPRIVYVSCDVATLARDARRLVDRDYTLARVDGFDLFPNTPHVETVAVFEK